MKLHTLIKIVKTVKTLTNKVLPCFLQDYCYRILGSGTYLPQVEFHIVDHCNLNCAHCDHFTPLADTNFADIQEIINDFKKLKKVFDHVKKIYILGGEPLLHPNLLEIFEPLRSLYPKSEIVIITNGILVDKQEDIFWQTLKKYDIAISMTRYPLKVDYDKHLTKCNSYNLHSYFFNMDRDKMQKMNLDYKGRRNKNRAFDMCTRKRCHFLRDGKLYLCTPVPNVCFLNKYFNLNFQVKKSDYIDLNKVKSASKIKKIFSKPIDFCRYCNDKEIKYDKYRISKKELSEWVLEDTV